MTCVLAVPKKHENRRSKIISEQAIVATQSIVQLFIGNQDGNLISNSFLANSFKPPGF
jgi:hypothetical protein